MEREHIHMVSIHVIFIYVIPLNQIALSISEEPSTYFDGKPGVAPG